jgi:hypothetical protein
MKARSAFGGPTPRMSYLVRCIQPCCVAAVVVLVGCHPAPPPKPMADLPPCGSAKTPECNGTCPFEGQTCYLRPGYPTCNCY